MKFLWGLALALAVSGCVDYPAPTIAFAPEEAAFINKTGAGVIRGHAFRTRQSGTVVNAAGQVVRLIPATAYARERFAQLFGGRKFIPHAAFPRENADPAYTALSRSTKAAANGRFAFENVAPGEYFVITTVIWGADDSLYREGGAVYDSVTLTGKETGPVDLILSGH